MGAVVLGLVFAFVGLAATAAVVIWPDQRAAWVLVLVVAIAGVLGSIAGWLLVAVRREILIRTIPPPTTRPHVGMPVKGDHNLVEGNVVLGGDLEVGGLANTIRRNISVAVSHLADLFGRRRR